MSDSFNTFTPLTERDRALLRKVFSDFMEVPDLWKGDLAAWLESNPPTLGNQVLGQRITLGQLPSVEIPKTFTFLNGWVDFGSGYSVGRYFKDLSGVVHLEGVVQSGSAATITTLPVGYRPATIRVFPSVVGSGVAGRVDVNAAGDVYLVTGSGFVTLDGMSFKAG